MKIEYHDELNPKLWSAPEPENAALKDDVHTALLKAGKAFIEFLKVPKVEMLDITITGSCANYNWTSSSDIDLHIVIDLKQATEEYGELIKEYLDAKKSVWNDLHDIRVRDIPVEFYVQDEAEKHYSTGVYSIQDSKWVIVPEHKEPDVDNSDVASKAKDMMKLIDGAVATNRAAVVEKVMEKIRNMRKAGLEEAGEFSTENLAFKILRNTGYLEKLAKVRINTFDRELSIEEEEWSYLKDQMSKLPVRQPYIHY
jgi:predicted nucleotidyltransferase